MKREEFDKGINEFRKISLSRAEKDAMLENIFKAPVESPFFEWKEVSSFFRKPLMAGYVLASFALALTSVAYTAEMSVPGETLYAVKTAVFEPIRDQITLSPEEKLEWETEKIERRIEEAEALAEEQKLDDEKTAELEEKIRKSSAAFSKAADKVASSTATTTEGRAKKAEALKESFRKKIKERGDDDREERSEEKEKIKKLKDRAVKALDEKEDDEGRGNSRGISED